MGQFNRTAMRRVLKGILGLPEDMTVMLAHPPQPSALLAVIDPLPVWRQESLIKKVSIFFLRKWEPTEALIAAAARQCFAEEIFGPESDYGDSLFGLMVDHHSRTWDFSALMDEDSSRSKALESMTVLTDLRFHGIASHPSLNLNLAQRVPQVCELVHPMVSCIPVISLRYFLRVHSRFAFAAIRRSSHPQADDIIAYLYELLFLQQKAATSLLEFLRLAAYARIEKDEAQLINAEINAIIGADAVFSHLKASIEKTISLVALTHGLTGMDGRKTHALKLNALRRALPQVVQETPYCQFLMERNSSASLDDLNRYRSGLLHKKGIADLQPHNYVDVKARALPLLRVFEVLHDQHADNTATLLCGLALLTDELNRREFYS